VIYQWWAIERSSNVELKSAIIVSQIISGLSLLYNFRPMNYKQSTSFCTLSAAKFGKQ
jgi:hypothetical protein